MPDNKLTLRQWTSQFALGSIRELVSAGSTALPIKTALSSPQLAAIKLALIGLKRVLPERPRFQQLEGIDQRVAFALDNHDLVTDANIVDKAIAVAKAIQWLRDGFSINDEQGIVMFSPPMGVDP